MALAVSETETQVETLADVVACWEPNVPFVDETEAGNAVSVNDSTSVTKKPSAP